MRNLVATCFVALAAWSLSIESHSAKGAQPARPEPVNPPEARNAPPQTPPQSAPTPAAQGQTPPPEAPAQMPPAAGPGQTLPPSAPGTTRSPVLPRARQQPAAAPARPLQSVFLIPNGLSMPPEDLFRTLGYDPVTSIPLTPLTCFDIAYQCYLQEYYSDAIEFARHGLTMCDDARLHLIKGVCELHLARNADAERSAAAFRNALTQQQLFGLDAARERINESLRVRFDDIVIYQNTGR